MEQILEQQLGCKTEFTAESKKDFMLAVIRTAHAKVQMLALEIAEVGTSLKHDMITAESAVTWLDYIGAVEFINVPPFTNKIEVAA
jgi:hypothetical protein